MTRVCPGRHLADASLFLACASILHAFNITPPLDENGHPVKLEAKVTTGLVISCVISLFNFSLRTYNHYCYIQSSRGVRVYCRAALFRIRISCQSIGSGSAILVSSVLRVYSK